MMKLKKGDYISLTDLSVEQFQAATKIFQDAGFNDDNLVIWNNSRFLGVDDEGYILSLKNFKLYGTERYLYSYEEIVGIEHQDGFMNLTTAQVTPVNLNKKYDKYFKDVSGLDEIDIYMILSLYQVTDHAIGHAIKKLLLAGDRTGGKSSMDDLVEARDTLTRKLDMLEQLSKRNPE